MNKIDAKKKLEDNNLSSSFVDYLDKYLDDKEKFDEAIERLIDGEPIQYIVGNTNFYGYDFLVNKNVLIPRFETEELVDYLIKYIKKYFDKEVSILDLGTGSGCIAITLAKELSISKVDAVDISEEALEVAKSNNNLNSTNVNFIQSDMFSNVTKKYDVIVSNPPYISYDEEIMDLVKNNEPSLALYADNNGLYYYELIIKESSKYMNDNSILAFEIGSTQGRYIKKFQEKYLPNSKFILKQDMQGRDRMVFIFNGNYFTDLYF